MGQGISVLARALGDDVRQVSPDPEDAGSAREWLTARGAQKGGLEIRSDPPLAGAAQRGDSEPDRHVRSRHEYWPTDPAARTLELIAERRFEGALAGAERAQSESEIRVERRAGEPAFKLLSTRPGAFRRRTLPPPSDTDDASQAEQIGGQGS